MSESHARPAPHHSERVVDGATVVEMHGEIDILTAPPVAARLDALSGRPRPDLVLDLRPMSFIDCSGLRLLCRARNRTLARQGRLRLVTGSGCFLRILRSTQLTDVFEIHSDLSTALSAVPRRNVAPSTR